MFKEPFFCAVLAFALNSAVYTSVLLRGLLNSIPNGECEACIALGMTNWVAFYRVKLPKALRLILPAYSNEVVMLLKSTSLASTITLMDIMGVTRQIMTNTYAIWELLIFSGILYGCLTAIFICSLRWLERRLLLYS